jgi:tetratricopeptide (TPR) repeat protein
MDSNETTENTFNFEDLLPDAETVECEDLFAKVWKLYELDKVRKTVAILTTIIKRNPQFGKAYSLLGKIYQFKYRNYEAAEKYYLAAIKASPKYRLGYKDYFYFLRNDNRFEEAKQYI